MVKSLAITVLWMTAATAITLAQRVSTFRSGVDLIALSVVVLDPEERFISGLSAEDFQIYEDGVQQNLSFFSAGQTPLDLAILLDTSASMAGKLETAQQAAIGFVDTLRPDDRLLVMDIKHSSQVLAPLSSDTTAARVAIASTSASGGTSLYDGLYLTLKEIARQRTDDSGRARGRDHAASRRQALVVVSDGWDTSSLVSFDDVMAEARRTGIAIYTIMLRQVRRPGLAPSAALSLAESEYVMRAFARETGGRSFSPHDVGELADIYDRIADELAQQYALGYTSSNPGRDGAYRRLTVRVVDHDGARVRTRAGYLAPRG